MHQIVAPPCKLVHPFFRNGTHCNCIVRYLCLPAGEENPCVKRLPFLSGCLKRAEFILLLLFMLLRRLTAPKEKRAFSYSNCHDNGVGAIKICIRLITNCPVMCAIKEKMTHSVA